LDPRYIFAVPSQANSYMVATATDLPLWEVGVNLESFGTLDHFHSYVLVDISLKCYFLCSFCTLQCLSEYSIYHSYFTLLKAQNYFLENLLVVLLKNPLKNVVFRVHRYYRWGAGTTAGSGQPPWFDPGHVVLPLQNFRWGGTTGLGPVLPVRKNS
jgi:hypothetical protein